MTYTTPASTVPPPSQSRPLLLILFVGGGGVAYGPLPERKEFPHPPLSQRRLLSRGGGQGGQVCSPPLEGKEFPYPLLLYNILLPPIWSPLPTTSSPAIHKLGGGGRLLSPPERKEFPHTLPPHKYLGEGGRPTVPPPRGRRILPSFTTIQNTSYSLLPSPFPNNPVPC